MIIVPIIEIIIPKISKNSKMRCVRIIFVSGEFGFDKASEFSRSSENTTMTCTVFDQCF